MCTKVRAQLKEWEQTRQQGLLDRYVHLKGLHSFLALRCSTDWRSHRTKVAPQVGPYSHCMLLTIVTLAAGLLVASSMLVGIR